MRARREREAASWQLRGEKGDVFVEPIERCVVSLTPGTQDEIA